MESRISGAEEFREFFGAWTDCHDAELLEIHLNRTGTSYVRLLNRQVLPGDREFTIGKAGIVTLELEEISGLTLTGFSPQNVISSLDIAEDGDGIEVGLRPCYGLAGTIRAKSLRIRVAPFDSTEAG